jgi:hypothetical protein
MPDLHDLFEEVVLKRAHHHGRIPASAVEQRGRSRHSRPEDAVGDRLALDALKDRITTPSCCRGIAAGDANEELVAMAFMA